MNRRRQVLENMEMIPDRAGGKPPDELEASLGWPVTPVISGRANAFLAHGTVRLPSAPAIELRLVVSGGATGSVNAELVAEQRRPGEATATSGPCSRFWAVVPLLAAGPEREAVLEAEVGLDGGGRLVARLGTISLAKTEPVAAEPASESARGIAICMATYEPNLELLRRQLESIRAQSADDWICLISDDCSSPRTFARIQGLVGDDSRFSISRSSERLGFYRNYERVLSLVPADVTFIALADQDDRWYTDKLEVLIGEIGETMLAYSDARVVDPLGAVRARTYWTHRHNNWTSLASMAFANTVTGAAALFRRELLDIALPFPPAHARFFHDHWLAFAALAAGELTYVDRPLYDYVQHRQAVLGHEQAHVWALRRRSRRQRVRHFLDDPDYFYGLWRRTYFLDYCRVLVFARVIELRCGDRLSPGKRRVIERLLAGERSPASIAWLAARGLRGWIGRNETLGSEGRILRGLAWRRLLALSARRPERTNRWLPRDASLPVFDPTESPAALPDRDSSATSSEAHERTAPEPSSLD